MPRLVHPTFARWLQLIALSLVAAGLAQASSDTVTELGREGRSVMLALKSGPHPYPGDYPVTVIVPLGYETSTETYPVIYLFDAFTFLDDHDALCAEKLIQPAILVSIGNKTSESRRYDLTPAATEPLTGGLEQFARLITEELKPYVDAHFRTRPEPDSTGVIGNSFGGLAACWLGYMHAETFGLAGCLEPSLWWNNNELLNHLLRDTTPKFATRFWIMAADQDSPGMWQNAKYGAYGLTQRGWVEGRDVAFCQVHNYPHGSAGARAQARDMLHFLLRREPSDVVRIELTNCHGPQLVALRPDELGGAAYAFLDVWYRNNVRTTAIAPALTVADPRVVSLVTPLLGCVVPVRTGWTTVSTDYAGFHAVIDVQGVAIGSTAEPPSRPAPPRLLAHPEALTVAPGGSALFTVSATGAGATSYQWRRDGQVIAGATTNALVVEDVTAGGAFDVIVSNETGGSVLSRQAPMLVAIPNAGRLANLSVLSSAGTAAAPLIVGFSVAGGAKRMLVRAVGPTLANSFAVPGAVADPRLTMYQPTSTGERLIATNDDWSTPGNNRDACAGVCDAVGAFPLLAASRDAALLLDVEGARTLHASASGPGLVLVECYDTGAGNVPRLANLSVRTVASDRALLVAGFVVTGNVPTRFLLRGIGPTLATQFSIVDALPDPVLELHATVAARDMIVAQNDDWADEPGCAGAAVAVGAFALPAASRDAALCLTLPAGAYTVHLKAKDGASGQGLIEIYEMPAAR